MAMGVLAVALAFTGQTASPEGKSKFSFKDSFHGAIACFRRIRQGCTNEMESILFAGVHHLDPSAWCSFETPMGW
jgi:hypothetical protein